MGKRTIGYGFDTKGEIRTKDGGIEYEGVAVPYNAMSQLICGYFQEQFRSGAFAKSLASNRRVVCCVNHDRNKLLASTTNGTLQLIDGPDELRVIAKFPNTSYANDIADLIQRREVNGMSFEFMSLTDKWEKRSGVPTRIVEEAELFEVCFTDDPAYLQTSASKRSMFMTKEEIDGLFIEGTPNLDYAKEKLKQLGIC